MHHIIRKFWLPVLFFAAFALALAIFEPALARFAVLNAPDSPPDFSLPGLWRRTALWICGSSPCLSHGEALRIALPSLVFHEASFALDAALQALAMAIYLRVVGLRPAACCAGGLAIAFSGYNFTLFNAGHRGYADMMPYGLLLFALIESAVQKPSLPVFVLMAVCAVCGLSTQPDVMVFVAMLAAFYCVFRVFVSIRNEGAKQFFHTRCLHFIIGFIVLAVSFAAFGFGTIRHVLVDVVSAREAQIAASSSKNAQDRAENARSNEATEEQKAKESKERWLFATNWSLPPEDILEFVAPNVRGRDSGNAKAPYWGRLGEIAGAKPGTPGYFPNYRQHSLYIGAPVIGFSIFAVFVAFYLKSDSRRPLVFFWLAAAVVSIALALGRYGFLYRAFFNIPAMDKVRAPVKFVHLAEISFAVLFAFGIQFLSSMRPFARNGDLYRRAARLTVGFSIAAAAAMCLATACVPSVPAEFGIPASTIAGGWKAGLAHGALLFAFVAAVLGFAAWSKEPFAQIANRFAAPVTIAIVALDLAMVASGYVSVKDVSNRYGKTAASKALLASGPADGRGWSYLMLAKRPLPDAALGGLGSGLDGAGFFESDPKLGEGPDSLRAKVWTAFGGDISKVWSFWGVAGAFASPSDARAVAESGLGRILAPLDMSETGIPVRAAKPRSPQLALFAPTGVPPSAGVWHDWKTVAADGIDVALDALSAQDCDLRRTLALYDPTGRASLPSPSAKEPENAVITESSISSDGRFATVSGTSSSPGVLFLREYRLHTFWPDLRAEVNGSRVQILRANGLFLAVPVPEGAFVARISARPPWAKLALPLAGWIVTFLAFVSWMHVERKKYDRKRL